MAVSNSASNEKFQIYHRENPEIFQTLRHFAIQAVRAGRKRIGIRMLWERLRWYTTVEAQGDAFKINNNYSGFYARLLMQERELAGVFETRSRK